MPTFKTKPTVIEAVQFFAADKSTHMKVNYGWPRDAPEPSSWDGRYWVQTSEGPRAVGDGDWIITDANGSTSVCAPDVFEKTYEQINA